MAKKKRWIQGALEGVKGHPFAAKAKAAGETTRQFAAEKADAPGKVGAEARLAQTLMGMHKPREKPKGRSLYRS